MAFEVLHLGAASTGQMLLAIGALIVLTIAGGLVILRLRRRMLGGHTPSKEGLLLADLRAMRDHGEISADEFESLRAAALCEHGYAPAPGPQSRDQAQSSPSDDPGVSETNGRPKTGDE